MPSAHFGPLDALPLTACDFSSACYTALVPRRALTLVLVRVIAASREMPSIDRARCRTVAFLFDMRHTLAALRPAIASAIASTRRGDESAELGERATVYARAPNSRDGGTTLPLVFDKSSRVSESDADDDGSASTETIRDKLYVGSLRSAAHTGSAQRAYRVHCDTKAPPVCVRKAVRVWNAWSALPRSAKESLMDERQNDAAHLVTMFVESLRVQTCSGQPTTMVPECVACIGSASCNCFLDRAMYRGGTQWLLFYAVLPPCSHSSLPPGLLPLPAADEWLEHLFLAEREMAAAAATHLSLSIRSIEPRRWRADSSYPVCTPAMLAGRSDIVASSERLALFDQDDVASTTASEDTASSSTTTQNYEDFPPSLIETACVWASNRPAFRETLGDAVSLFGVYYAPTLQCVLQRQSSGNFSVRLRRAARALTYKFGDAALVECLRAHDKADSALLEAAERFGGSAVIDTLARCLDMGHMVASLIALACYCDMIERRNGAYDDPDAYRTLVSEHRVLPWSAITNETTPPKSTTTTSKLTSSSKEAPSRTVAASARARSPPPLYLPPKVASSRLPLLAQPVRESLPWNEWRAH